MCVWDTLGPQSVPSIQKLACLFRRFLRRWGVRLQVDMDFWRVGQLVSCLHPIDSGKKTWIDGWWIWRLYFCCRISFLINSKPLHTEKKEAVWKQLVFVFQGSVKCLCYLTFVLRQERKENDNGLSTAQNLLTCSYRMENISLFSTWGGCWFWIHSSNISCFREWGNDGNGLRLFEVIQPVQRAWYCCQI